MPQITDVEIFEAALAAGFTPDQAVTMTAIAIAESGGNTEALNPNGEYSVGLWQINTAVHSDIDPIDAQDPLVNARAAFRVSGGGADITRWTVTHQISGARYLDFRSRAEQAAASSGFAEAEGNWNAPRDYFTPGAGAAASDSTSQPLFDPADPSAGPLDRDTPIGDAPDARLGTRLGIFDTDDNRVFDSIERFTRTNLAPGPDLAPLPGPSAGSVDDPHGGAGTPGHHHGGEPVDPAMLVNGQFPAAALEAVPGGNDFLAAGQPANSWRALVEAARADGIDITFSDAYRPIADQERLADELGLYGQGGLAAVPGTSNHGLGLAVDVNQTPESLSWLSDNAARFGWVDDVPGEPWHFDYKAALDPDPGRPIIGSIQPAAGLGVDDVGGPRPNVFDRDANALFDPIEAWVAKRAFRAEDFEPDEDRGRRRGVSTAPILPDRLSDDTGLDDSGSHVPGGDPSLDPAQSDANVTDWRSSFGDLDDHRSALTDILASFDLDPDGDLVLDRSDLTDTGRLRDALLDYVDGRPELDRESFASHYDELFHDDGGPGHHIDLLDLFDHD